MITAGGAICCFGSTVGSSRCLGSTVGSTCCRFKGGVCTGVPGTGLNEARVGGVIASCCGGIMIGRRVGIGVNGRSFLAAVVRRTPGEMVGNMVGKGGQCLSHRT